MATENTLGSFDSLLDELNTIAHLKSASVKMDADGTFRIIKIDKHPLTMAKWIEQKCPQCGSEEVDISFARDLGCIDEDCHCRDCGHDWYTDFLQGSTYECNND